MLESGAWQFYGLVTDLQLGAIDPRYAEIQSNQRLSRTSRASWPGRRSTPTWRYCRR